MSSIRVEFFLRPGERGKGNISHWLPDSLGVSSKRLDFVSVLERTGKTKPWTTGCIFNNTGLFCFSGLERTEKGETYIINSRASLGMSSSKGGFFTLKRTEFNRNTFKTRGWRGG